MAQPKLTLAEVDGLIERILLTNSQRFTQLVTANDIKALCNSAIEVLRVQPSLVEIDPPVVVCGDIHGQFSDLMRIFSRVGFPPLKNFLFLGDYVDRGRQSIETAVLLLAYKTRYPANFFLLRGNHECSNINRVYGFLEEIRRRFPHDTQSLWALFQLSTDSAVCVLCTDHRTTEILFQLFHRFCGKRSPQILWKHAQNLWKHPQILQNIQKHAKTTEFYFNYFSVHRKKSTDLWLF
ncbi:unnamed protein product [Meloidogyne enterolobii]|uniref:Uncharacterized protein n=1 Tax=Meloidogyne enterolobii TaxID=390850 RepID=A0ACB0XNY2_MELEN